ncbi:MAG: hypothetical protein ACMG6E_07480, partial [Candidatus Roizmanbacteria bacterium]
AIITNEDLLKATNEDEIRSLWQKKLQRPHIPITTTRDQNILDDDHQDRKQLEKLTTLAHTTLRGLKWITSNPGRQWTSSINPAIINIADYYGETFYRVAHGHTPVIIGLAPDIEMTLRHAWTTMFDLSKELCNLLFYKIILEDIRSSKL